MRSYHGIVHIVFIRMRAYERFFEIDVIIRGKTGQKNLQYFIGGFFGENFDDVLFYIKFTTILNESLNHSYDYSSFGYSEKINFPVIPSKVVF